MKHLLLLLIQLIPILIFSQTNHSLKVKLLDFTSDKILAYCGYIPYATTLKFEIIDNIDTLINGEEIFVIVTCPREYGIENYVNYAIYNLLILGDSEEDKKLKNYGWTIWHEYNNDNLSTFWAKKLEKLE